MEISLATAVVNGSFTLVVAGVVYFSNKKSKKRIIRDDKEQDAKTDLLVQQKMSSAVEGLSAYIKTLEERSSLLEMRGEELDLRVAENEKKIKELEADKVIDSKTILENTELLYKNGAAIEELERDNRLCKYQHEVAKLEQAQIKKQIGHHNYVIEDVYVVDDDIDELNEFNERFQDISIVKYRGFTSVYEFLEETKKNQPHIVVLDYNLGHTTADKILDEIGYEPEVFIISGEKSYEARFAGKKVRFFHKEQDYVFKIAIDIIKHLNEKN